MNDTTGGAVRRATRRPCGPGNPCVCFEAGVEHGRSYERDEWRQGISAMLRDRFAWAFASLLDTPAAATPVPRLDDALGAIRNRELQTGLADEEEVR